MSEILLVALLVIVGVVLLVLEMFLIPGFGIAGVSGFACLVGAVVAAYLKISALAGHITLAAGVILSGLAIWGFLRSRALDKMALDTKIDSKVELAKPGKKIERLEEEAQKIDAKEQKATKKAAKR
ncbi:MAG: hypothetical protein II588_05480 [Paludibacteraceae bacterium]|nr:hypothetical protein [Paludibacteraceae bacterium]